MTEKAYLILSSHDGRYITRNEEPDLNTIHIYNAYILNEEGLIRWRKKKVKEIKLTLV